MDPTVTTSPPPVDAVAPSPAAAKAVPTTRQAVTGVVPPEVGEAKIRETWPTLLEFGPALPNLAQTLMKTIILAPIGWLLLAPLFVRRLLPGLCQRYTLTNRRLMIQRGLKPAPYREVQLKDIDDVRIVDSTRDRFYLSATIEVLSGGKVVLTLPGVPEPVGFRLAIRNAISAWVPGKRIEQFISATGVKAEDISAKPAAAAK